MVDESCILELLGVTLVVLESGVNEKDVAFLEVETHLGVLECAVFTVGAVKHDGAGLVLYGELTVGRVVNGLNSHDHVISVGGRRIYELLAESKCFSNGDGGVLSLPSSDNRVEIACGSLCTTDGTLAILEAVLSGRNCLTGCNYGFANDTYAVTGVALGGTGSCLCVLGCGYVVAAGCGVYLFFGGGIIGGILYLTENVGKLDAELCDYVAGRRAKHKAKGEEQEQKNSESLHLFLPSIFFII